jgi:ABC-2 type transport system permease protein
MRIIGAIATKDIVAALRDGKILTALLSVLFVVVAYKTMPSWLDADQLPRVAVYDPGGSALVAQLENSPEFDLWLMPTRAALEQTLGEDTQAVLGLVLPPDLDDRLEAGQTIQLDGYVDHWVSASAAETTRTFFEQQLEARTGKSLPIRLQRGEVYTEPLGGQPVTVSLVITFVLTVLGLLVAPNLMVEEKEGKTMDVLMVSPAAASEVVLAKALVGLFYCLLGATVALGFFGILIVHWDIAILAVVCGAVFSVALGLLLGTYTSLRQQLVIWSSVLMIPLLMPVFLAIILPELRIPGAIVTAIRLLPTVALSETVRLSASRTAPWSSVWSSLALVLAYAAALLVAVVWKIRRSDR